MGNIAADKTIIGFQGTKLEKQVIQNYARKAGIQTSFLLRKLVLDDEKLQAAVDELGSGTEVPDTLAELNASKASA